MCRSVGELADGDMVHCVANNRLNSYLPDACVWSVGNEQEMVLTTRIAAERYDMLLLIERRKHYRINPDSIVAIGVADAYLDDGMEIGATGDFETHLHLGKVSVDGRRDNGHAQEEIDSVVCAGQIVAEIPAGGSVG